MMRPCQTWPVPDARIGRLIRTMHGRSISIRWLETGLYRDVTEAGRLSIERYALHPCPKTTSSPASWVCCANRSRRLQSPQNCS